MKKLILTGFLAVTIILSSMLPIYSQELFKLKVDKTPPSVPTGVLAVTQSSTEIDVSWLASRDNVGVVGYEISSSDGVSRWDVNITNSEPSRTLIVYKDTGLTAETHHCYQIRAYDAAGNYSNWSTPNAKKTCATTNGPPPPTGAYLVPYNPTGWFDKLVVSNSPSCSDTNCTESSSFLQTDTLYVNWAVVNNGSAATSVTFYTNLYIDGKQINQWYTDPPMDPTYYIYVMNYQVGSLSAGGHSIEIVTDSTNVIDESNENDNIYIKTITVGSAPPPTNKPNLTPYKPQGWSDKIVVTNKTGCTAYNCTDSSPLLPTDTFYVDWAVINNGAGATSVTFYTQLYVDGSLKQNWSTSPPVNPNSYASVNDYSIGWLSAGTHALKIVADSTNTVDESNENDNIYTKTITVGSSPPTGQCGSSASDSCSALQYTCSNCSAIFACANVDVTYLKTSDGHYFCCAPSDCNAAVSNMVNYCGCF